MTVAHHTVDANDAAVVALQLGREPRGHWRTAVRCSYGKPQVIETQPRLQQDTPFPTLYYLTCPWLVELVGELESAGAVPAYAARLSAEEGLAARMKAADAEYRARRALAAHGDDPLPGVGIAGQRDPLATKCIHAHVAARLAGIDDPVGDDVLTTIEHECPDDRCSRLTAQGGEAL